MFKSHLRLNPKEIPVIAKKGKRYSSELLDIKIWFDSNLENSQFAISISTKIDKRAVVRNKIKRKLRVAIHELEKENYFKKGKYLIIVRSDKLKEAKNGELTTAIKTILSF